jgi:deazaflavin-dependent oxidoreductase (nitroreductase family)
MRRVGYGATMSLFTQTLRVHQAIYEATGGLIGHRILGKPTLLLHTTGRKSGASRTNALVYARDGDRYLVVASKGGADSPPAWLLNLQANPQIDVQIARNRRPAVATVIAHDDPDFERVFKLADDANDGRYAAYQGKTDREIPVVALKLAG